MFQGLTFEPFRLPDRAEAVRREVRQFLDRELDSTVFLHSDASKGSSAEFSSKVAQPSWIGMTWPEQYGGGGCTYLGRNVVAEELLAAGALTGRGRGLSDVTLAMVAVPPDEAFVANQVERGSSHLLFHLPTATEDVILPMLDSYAELAAKMRA